MSFEYPNNSDHVDSPEFIYSRNGHPVQFPAFLYHTGTIALSGIAVRAGALGFVCALALNATWAFRSSFPQLPFFIASLALFHFMEFWLTARYNTRRANLEGIFISVSLIAQC